MIVGQVLFTFFLCLTFFLGTTHLLVNKSSECAATLLPDLISGRLPEKSLISLVVIDPPYGLDKAHWDTPEAAEKWASQIIPKFLEDTLKLNCFHEDFKIVIFHHFDTPYLEVCFF